MAFKKDDKIYFCRGPMEFIGVVLEAGLDTIRASGVEIGCEAESRSTVMISMSIKEPHALRVLNDTEFAERTKHEPVFGGTSM